MAVIHIDDILLLKATLRGGPDASCDGSHRTIAMAKTMSLYDLAEMITAAFNFELDHNFGFYDNMSNPPASREAYEILADVSVSSGFPGVKKARLFRVFTEPGKAMLFIFDYEAGWRFTVELAGITPPEPGIRYPKIVDSAGPSPRQYPEPEENGGNGNNEA